MRIALKWKGVEWILWLFLMEDISLTILPVGEVLCITTESQDWLVRVVSLCLFLKKRFDFMLFVCCLILSVTVHWMRVYDFCLFLKVKCFLLLDQERALGILLKVFLVATSKVLGIWISHKLVRAPRFPRWNISSLQSGCLLISVVA